MVAGDVILLNWKEHDEAPDIESVLAPGVKLSESMRKSIYLYRLHTHSTLAWAVRCFGSEILKYKIVTYARNPWDRAISDFYYHCEDSNSPFYNVCKGSGMRSMPIDFQRESFKLFVKSSMNLKFNRKIERFIGMREDQSDLDMSCYCMFNGAFKADNVIFYETLSENLKSLSDELGIEIDIKSQKRKTDIRSAKSRNVVEFYDDETISLVAQACARDIKLFSYEYGNDKLPHWSKI